MKSSLAILAVFALAQVCRAEDDPVEVLKSALKSTESAGGFRCEGDVKREGGGAMVQIGGLGGGGRAVTGKMDCRVDAEGDVEFRVTNREDDILVVRVGGKTVKQASWSGQAPDVDAFAATAGKLVSWKSLRSALKKAKKAKLVRDGELDVVTLRLAGSFLEPDKDTSAGPNMSAMVEGSFMETRGIDARFEIDHQSGLLKSMRFEVRRGYGDAILSAVEEKGGKKKGYGEWGDEEKDKDEEEEQEKDGDFGGGLKLADTKTVYEFRSFELDADLDVKLPKARK
ncbi:MAG: hypothetical protein FD180_3436 [Planctomycetota bacterium]|nr:MAG: hypothetical protein FD180_3436 [Planctomycetota bacterium]